MSMRRNSDKDRTRLGALRERDGIDDLVLPVGEEEEDGACPQHR